MSEMDEMEARGWILGVMFTALGFLTGSVLVALTYPEAPGFSCEVREVKSGQCMRYVRND